MDDNDDWIQQKYKIDQFYKMNREFRSLELPYMLVAIAPNGGPIAITSDKTEILALKPSDPSIENVCIFNNEGELSQKIKIDNHFKEVIVCFDFTKDEQLLVVFEKGYYWVVDPHRGTFKKFDIKAQIRDGEGIVEGKVFDNGFAFFTSGLRYMFVKDCNEPLVGEFCDNELKGIPTHWVVLPPKQIISEKVEIHFPHPTAGIVQLFENNKRKDDEKRRVHYNKGANREHMVNGIEIKHITYISSMSNNGRYIVYFSSEPIFKNLPEQGKDKKKGDKVPAENQTPDAWVYRLIITSTDFQGSFHKSVELKKINDSYLNSKKCPRKIVWCGDEAIVIQYRNGHLFMVMLEDLQIVRIDKDRWKNDDFTFMKQEIDGVRLLTKEKNRILRRIPQSYFNIFVPLSQKPGALLFSAYTAFEQKEPLQDDEIRSKKKELADAVLDCIYGAKFEEKVEICIQLMKAASYGKSFLQPNQIPNNMIQEVCKNLRVLNQLRNHHRAITYAQFQALSEEGLLRILLRYNLHYLAFEIFRYLKKSQKFRIQIYTHWACCKVESEQDEESICQDIKAQLQNEKGVSFTEIAHKAIEMSKADLALRLLEHEPSLAKKVPLLLWMGTAESSRSSKFFERAIADAELSKDPNLLCLAIQKIRLSARLTETEMFELFSKSYEGRCALVSYYRIFDGSSLIRFYEFTRDFEMLGLFALHSAYKTMKYADHIKFMEASLAKFGQEGKNSNDWRKEALAQYISLYNTFIKNFPKAETKNEGGGKTGVIKPGPINELVDFFIAKNNADAVDDVKATYKISDKRIILSRIKALINQGKWEELERVVDQYQKKLKLPVEMIADMVMKKREETWALRIMAKMPEKEKEQQYQLLQRIGKIREAIDIAVRRKDADALEDIRRTLEDPDLLSYLNEQCNTFRK